jgi:UDP-N-acetylglucosamine 2-epimerase (non-hydrolysing)
LKICIVAGARPNFMKIAPIIDAIFDYNQASGQQIGYCLIHTGQHYDSKMSELFFNNLGLPEPDFNLGVGSASHSEQTAEIMKRFEKVCLEESPTHIIVVGDVNSTIACSLVASKLGIKVIHVEAGLRSFDRSMPEEINRVLTDTISDCLFTTEKSAEENLRREGISDEKIHFVGNVMIDTLLKHKKKAQQSNILHRLGLINSQPNNSIKQGNLKNPIAYYAVLTLHRPSNVDDKETFQDILEALLIIGKNLPIFLPIHPRTYNRIKEFGFEKYFNWELYNSTSFKKLKNGINPTNSINAIQPLGYLDFLKLMSDAKLVLTDSGGIQEETSILKTPCVTIRKNTERPVTVEHGTNRLVGTKKEDIIMGSLKAIETDYSQVTPPPLWDGKAAKRIVEILVSRYH